MVKIINKINNATQRSEPYFSLEFFPPKTEAGVENLYLRIERMTALQPIFVDVTWGAGGSTKDLTMTISEYTQKYFGVEVLMHLTCTNMTRTQLKDVLQSAKNAGIHNILALRGDPPKGAQYWEPITDGLRNAVDLVRLIRQEFGDYFGIAVAGFPEGYPQAKNQMDEDILHLKEKVDAGADFVLTQFFYDSQAFLLFRDKCLEAGITCPIIPGIMPIQSFVSFQCMTAFCRTHIPPHIWEDLLPFRENDEAVKEYGSKLAIRMCKELQTAGVTGFHFYTLNLEQSVTSILTGLHFHEDPSAKRLLPWRGYRSNLKGATEDVRPINWANRPQSYIQRTECWDEFPNGRWGDGRSPAFGELSNSHFFRPTVGSREERLAMWGDAPLHPEEVFTVFANYLEGKIPLLPWCDSPIKPETTALVTDLIELNKLGFLTINSQPAVNGSPSDDVVYGWGGPGGLVYQRAYLEFFIPPNYLPILMDIVKKYSDLTLHAVNQNGNLYSVGGVGVTALTWGIFPNKEILQPTVFDPETFVVWSKEAFQLWLSYWASLYDDENRSSELIYEIHDTYFLVAIIDNCFYNSNLFPVLVEVKDFFIKQTRFGSKNIASSNNSTDNNNNENNNEDGAATNEIHINSIA